MHPLLLLVAAAWLLPATLGRGLRAPSHPTSVSEQEPPERHDSSRLLRRCKNSQCFNCDLFDCFHRTSAECNREVYNICDPDEIPELFPVPAPRTAAPTNRATPPPVAKPLVLEKSSHPVIVSLGGLRSGWQTANPGLMDHVKKSTRLFSLPRLMKCKEEWDVPTDITGVSLVPGRIPGRPDSVLFNVQISAEIRGFADVIQDYVERCMERGRGDLTQRLKELDPNVFDDLSVITGSFDPRDVNNNPTPSPTDPVQQVEAAKTFPPSPAVVVGAVGAVPIPAVPATPPPPAIPAAPAIPVVPVFPAPQSGEGEEGNEGEEGDKKGGNLLADNMWLIGLAASSILLFFPCVMISRRAKKKRDAAKIEAKKTAMMMNQLKFGMSENTASTGISSAPDPRATAGALSALDSLIAVSAAAKPSQPHSPAPTPPMASVVKNGQPKQGPKKGQLNQGYVPTRRKPSRPHASKSRPVEATKRRNEAGGKKKPTRAAVQSKSNLKATSDSTQIVPYRPKTQQQRPDPPGAGEKRRSDRMKGERKSRRHTHAGPIPRREEQHRLSRSANYGTNYAGFNPKSKPKIDEDNRRTRSKSMPRIREDNRRSKSRSRIDKDNLRTRSKSMPRINEDNRRAKSRSAPRIAEERRLRRSR